MQNSLKTIFEEARIRIFWIFFCFFITCIISYHFSEYLLFVLIEPLLGISESNLLFLCTQMTESLNTYLLTSLVFALFFCFPYFFYQLWCFLIPSCTSSQRYQVGKYSLLSLLAFFFVFLLTYIFIIPNIWLFFYKINFAHTNSQNLLLIQLQPKIYDFVVLTLRFLFIASLVSQFPILLLYFLEYNIISLQDCLKNRKIFFLLSALFSALVTPPDFWCQIITWLSVCIVIELTILISLIQLMYTKIQSSVSDW